MAFDSSCNYSYSYEIIAFNSRQVRIRQVGISEANEVDYLIRFDAPNVWFCSKFFRQLSELGSNRSIGCLQGQLVIFDWFRPARLYYVTNTFWCSGQLNNNGEFVREINITGNVILLIHIRLLSSGIPLIMYTLSSLYSDFNVIWIWFYCTYLTSIFWPNRPTMTKGPSVIPPKYIHFVKLVMNSHNISCYNIRLFITDFIHINDW